MHRISEDGKLRIAGQADLILIENNNIRTGYKGLDLRTPILTTTGFKFLKNITKSDNVDKDGNETNILNISEIHNPC